jgi:endo-1,4-beta-xylanase
MIRLLSFTFILIVYSQSLLLAASQHASQYVPLKDLYADKFLVGNILAGGLEGNSLFRQDQEELALLIGEFNCLTAENSMKMQYVQPKEGVFNFKPSDALLHIANKAEMEVVGHALVWHHQVPQWIFKDKQGNTVSREVLIQRMKDHIYKVVTRYKGKIKYWDVVNEAVDLKYEDGKQVAFLRESPWYKIIGEDYIELAYRFAHEADPDALLLYNDYSMTDLVKTQFVADMVKDLKDKGIPIHGVGMQGHWHLEWPTNSDLRKALDILSEVGVKVSISELDVRVLPHPKDTEMGADIRLNVQRLKELDPYTDGIPDKILKKQAKKYASLFKVFLEYSDLIERVSFWGVVDHHSWLRDWPVKGRTVYPALFDRDYSPKPAYFAIRKLVE